MRIPGCDLFIADGPFDAIAITYGSREFEMTPAGAGASPDQGFAPNLVSADPVEGLVLNIGMILIFYEEMRRILSEARGCGDEWVFLDEGLGHGAAMGEFPGGHGSRGIIFEVHDIPSSFEHESLQALLAELFGGPSSADARPDHDGVEAVRGNAFGIDMK